jgi:hypothetical protein
MGAVLFASQPYRGGSPELTRGHGARRCDYQ